MRFEGTAKLDKRTKNLVKRIRVGDIALIDHADVDKVTAESLIETGVEVVVNADSFSTGKYPNIGPLILCTAGIHLIDNVGSQVFEKVREGEKIVIEDEQIYSNGDLVASGEVLVMLDLQTKLEEAKKSIGYELENFALNTIEHIQKEKELLFEGTEIPEIKTDFRDRHALVVVRGYEYKEDLKALKSYIREVKPIFIGVDGGADALLEVGLKPDIIIGDMDSVSDKALTSCSEIIVHAYRDGRAPGLERLNELGLDSLTFKSSGTSEDVALILAYEQGAEMIVAVGTHLNLVEFLDKGRKGMASTFLVRLKVGERLVDAKGVSRLYKSKVKVNHLLLLLFAALFTVSTIVFASASIRQLIRLVILNIRSIIGY